MGGLASASDERLPRSLEIDGDEEGWEYEYDENETEDYYFTVDLSASQARSAFEADHSNRSTVLRQKPTARKASFNTGGQANGSNGPVSTQAPPTDNGAETRLQVLDLHTNNPLLLLDNSLYSCEWSNELGTQLYVTRPGVSETCLKRGRVLDVIGASRARLLGRPVTLRARDVQDVGASAENAIAIDDDGDKNDDDDDNVADPINADTVGDAPEQPSAVVQNGRCTSVNAQASFFGRLAAIKQQKGETDVVKPHAMHKYMTPDCANEIRQQALEEDAAHQKEATAARKKQLRDSNKRRRSSHIDVDAATPARGGRKGGASSNAEIRASLGLSADSIPILSAQGPNTRDQAATSQPFELNASNPDHSAVINRPSPSGAHDGPTENQEIQSRLLGTMDLDVAEFPAEEEHT